jgi:hypothetical protein
VEKLSATVCGLWGHPVDPSRERPPEQVLICTDDVHRVCRRKTWRNFFRGLSTEFSTDGARFPVENWCGFAAGWGLCSYPERFRGVCPPPARTPAGSPADRLRPAAPLGYPSPVCSITGDAIGRIAEAIDQLASDVQAESGEMDPGALAARIAEVWSMISALDPELARRRREYTAPADDAPSI